MSTETQPLPKQKVVLNEAIRQMWQIRRREISSGRIHLNRKSLPPDLLILNRFGIGLPYLKVAQDLSCKFGIPAFDILIQAGVISREIWDSAQKMLASERTKALQRGIERRFLLRNAIAGLHSTRPEYSAAKTFTPAQMISFAYISLFAALFTLADFYFAVWLLIAGLTLFYFSSVVLRTFVISQYSDINKTRREICPVSDVYLPVYSVFIALYDEANQVSYLCNALSNLDWPKSKLDIKLICEADDLETIAAIHAQNLPPHFQLVLVPPAYPRTKPKALNYALPFAKGEYLVLYDAEDCPSPGQLREAYVNFLTRPQEVACLQAPLEIHNDRENWLCRMFAIEYLTLFRGLLPVLDRWKAPIPLGGTSNHFKTSVLQNIGGWDPFNVTEDADLGIRLHREGYQIGTISLPTFEEAPLYLDGWMKQRTRWIKGWMQTVLVHSRNPWLLLQQMGILNLAIFHVMITSLVVSALIHPFFLLYLYFQFAHLSIVATSASEVILVMSCTFNLVGGYASYGFLAYMVVKAHTNSRRYCWPILLLPFYWLLISVAAWRALIHLFTQPHKWEKTDHGLTRINTQGSYPDPCEQ